MKLTEYCCFSFHLPVRFNTVKNILIVRQVIFKIVNESFKRWQCFECQKITPSSLGYPIWTRIWYLFGSARTTGQKETIFVLFKRNKLMKLIYLKSHLMANLFVKFFVSKTNLSNPLRDIFFINHFGQNNN